MISESGQRCHRCSHSAWSRGSSAERTRNRSPGFTGASGSEGPSAGDFMGFALLAAPGNRRPIPLAGVRWRDRPGCRTLSGSDKSLPDRRKTGNRSRLRGLKGSRGNVEERAGAPMRRDRLRILVTGIHGDSGQGLVKALRFSRKAVLLHGCDSSESGLGAAFVPWLHLVPPARDRGDYVVRLDQICRKHRLDAVLPSLPVEIDALSTRTDPVTLPSGVPVICLPRTYRDVFDDKLLSYRSLERYVPLAPYADGADRSAVAALVRRSGFPIVVKRRKGRGGESFHCVEREQDLAEALQKTPDPVVQAFIDDAEGEFTVGVFAKIGR